MSNESRRLVYALSCVAVLLVLLAALCPAVAVAPASPGVKFDKTTVDFGEILHGQKTDILFPFKNVGEGVLLITKIDATCGCTTAKASKMKLKPGESAYVKVVFDSAHYVGKILKSVYISSNDPASPVVHLHLTGKVQSVAELTPPAMDLGDLTVGTAVEKTLTVTSKIAKPFKILKMTSDGKQVTVPKFDKLPGPDRTYSATIRATAGKAPGRLTEHVSITTDLPGLPPIQFLVYGNVINVGEENAEHP